MRNKHSTDERPQLYVLPPSPFETIGTEPVGAPAKVSISAPPAPSAKSTKRGARHKGTVTQVPERVARLAKSDGTVHVGEMLITPGSRSKIKKQRREAMTLSGDVRRERVRAKRATAKVSMQDLKNTNYLPASGERRRDALRTYVPAKAPVAAVTADKAAVAYPFLAEAGLGTQGILIGVDAWSGASFVYDPWEAYRRDIVSNPNILVAGIIGRGKSAFVKSLVTRSISVGVRTFVASDPKGEWTVVARAVGGQAIVLGGDSGNKLNPLDAPVRPPGVSEETWAVEVRRRRRELVGALTQSAMGRDMKPVESTALDVAIEAASESASVPVLGDVVTALLKPTHDVLGSTRAQLEEDGRDVGHALRRLVEGDLKGLFDGPSTVELNATLPMVSIDMSMISGSDTLIAMVSACAAAWMEAAIADPNGGKRYVVYDEAWRQVKDPALLARMQSQWKLSRALGITNIAVIHRLSDLDAVGDENSQSRNLALGLLNDCSTKVIYAQESGEAATLGARLGFSAVEIAHLPNLGKGQALWHVGQRAFLVNHRLTQGELKLFDTNARMMDEKPEGAA
jgi:hypothetical protein